MLVDSAVNESPTGIPWRVLAATLASWTLSNMDQSLFGYAIPSVLHDLNTDIDTIGLIISASFAFAIVSVPLVAAQVEKIGAPAVLTLSLAGSAVFVGLQAFPHSVAVFALMRMLGFGLSAAIVPVSSAFLAARSPHRGRAILIAIQQCGYPLGWFIASIIAAPLMTVHGWRATFVVAFAVVPFCALIFWALSSPRFVTSSKTRAADAHVAAGASERNSPALRELFTPAVRRRTLTFGSAFFLYGGAVGGTSFYLPTFFQQVRGYDVATATRVVGLSYAVGMIGYVASALISEFLLTRRATMVIWLLMAGVALMVMIWMPRTVTQDMIVFGITTIFFYGAASIMITGLLEQFPERLQTAAASVSGTACISLGFVVFPIVTAAAVTRLGWQMSFTVAIVPAVFAAGFLLVSLPRVRRTPWPPLRATL